MELQELKDLVADKTFESTAGPIYKFISGTTLQVNGYMANSVRYDIFQDDDGSFLLDHKGIVHTKINEPLRMEMNEQQNPTDPISFAIIGRISEEFFGTWVEILPNE